MNTNLKLVVNNEPRISPIGGDTDVDWLTPLETNTVFLCIKKGDSGYLLEEYLKSVQNGRGVMLVANGFTGGNIEFFWVRPQGFCRSYDLVEIVDTKVIRDGADHQPIQRECPPDQ